MSNVRAPISQIGQQHFAAAGLASSTALTLPSGKETPSHVMITANAAAGNSTLFVRFDTTAVTTTNGIAIPIVAGTSILLSLMDAGFDYTGMIKFMRLLTSDASALVDVLYFN